MIAEWGSIGIARENFVEERDLKKAGPWSYIERLIYRETETRVMEFVIRSLAS